MSTASFVVLGVNLLFIGLLPRIFFKQDGHFNWMWWATAMPFFCAGVVLLLAYLGLLTPVLNQQGLDIPGVLLGLASLGLIAYTLGTHERRIALWHQSNDAPEHIVTHGAYRYIRHPFYSAFLLALLGVVCLVPHVASLAIFVYALLLLNHTARREEAHLAGSAFGEDYRAYQARTGRFFPKGSHHA